MHGGRGAQVRRIVGLGVGFQLFSLLFASTLLGAVGAGTDAPVSAKTVDVNLMDTTFSPTSVTIDKGDSVRFVNKVAVCHTVTRGATVAGACSGTGSKAEADFDVVLTTTSDEATITFATVGTVSVYCKPHAPVMVLTITVQEPGTVPPPQKTPGFEAVAMFGALLGAAAVIGVILARRRGETKGA